jgi:hypothetical protein
LTEELLCFQVYDEHKGNAIMHTIPLVYILLFMLFLPATVLASSVKMFFTDEELTEMGVCIEPSDIEWQGVAA